jgi:hypothetical protein
VILNRLSIDYGRHVDFDQHAGMGELIYVYECMRRSRGIAKRLGKTFEVIAC